MLSSFFPINNVCSYDTKPGISWNPYETLSMLYQKWIYKHCKFAPVIYWYNRVPLEHAHICHNITFSTAMTMAEHKSNIRFTKDIPRPHWPHGIAMGCCEDFGENWPHYNRTALYAILISWHLLQRYHRGVTFCPINTSGLQWGQKFWSQRLRDFCPHCGPSGVFIGQNITPMWFCYYPTICEDIDIHRSLKSSWHKQTIPENASARSAKLVIMVTSYYLLTISQWCLSPCMQQTLQKYFIFECYWAVADPPMAPFASWGTANQIARTSWNHHHGLYWTLNPWP